MKMLKKAVALLIVAALMLSLTACHPKDETAISAGDYKITSAMYSYFLVMADNEAKTLIDSDESYDTSAANFSYYKQKIDDKSYEQYVKDLAIEKCLRHIALEKLCDEAELTLDDETKEGWQSTAQYYWNYSIGGILLENGVSYSTYEKLLLNDALYNLYFEKLYGEGGEKEVSEDSIKSGLTDNYSAVYMITHDYSEEEEPDVDAISSELDKYVASLKDGTAFTDVLAAYNAANGIESEDTSDDTASSDTASSDDSSSDSSSDETASDDTSSEEEEEEELTPVDTNITVLTDYEDTYTGEATLFDKYDEVEKMENGAVSLIHDEDAKCYYIVVKKDISADPYYLETLSEEILYLLKADEFENTLTETGKNLDYKVSSYAIGQFKVKNIYDGSEA